MTIHYSAEPLNVSGWAETICGIDDGGEVTNTRSETDCWECCAMLGMTDEQLERQCGPSFSGEADVLRAFGAIE